VNEANYCFSREIDAIAADYYAGTVDIDSDLVVGTV